MKRIFLSLFLIIFFNESIIPQVDLNKTAQSTMNFLLVGLSPKASAMGDAFTTVGSGSESMFYNPAGLSDMEMQFDITVNYTRWIADINYLGGGIAYNLNSLGVIGLNMLTVDYGVINGTSLITEAERDLYPLGYKDNGAVSNIGAYSVGLAYAKAISEEFSIGGNIKLVGQNLGQNIFSDGTERDNDAAQLAFDAGVKYRTGYKGFMFGMSIRNFSSNIKREEIEEQLPLLFSLGAAFDLLQVINFDPESSFLLAVDFLHQNNYTERMNFGGEYNFHNIIAIRGGYQTNRDLASWSAGIGLSQTILDYNVQINYSYSRFELFDSVSRLSLYLAF